MDFRLYQIRRIRWDVKEFCSHRSELPFVWHGDCILVPCLTRFKHLCIFEFWWLPIISTAMKYDSSYCCFFVLEIYKHHIDFVLSIILPAKGWICGSLHSGGGKWLLSLFEMHFNLWMKVMNQHYPVYLAGWKCNFGFTDTRSNFNGSKWIYLPSGNKWANKRPIILTLSTYVSVPRWFFFHRSLLCPLVPQFFYAVIS